MLSTRHTLKFEDTNRLKAKGLKNYTMETGTKRKLSGYTGIRQKRL